MLTLSVLPEADLKHEVVERVYRSGHLAALEAQDYNLAGRSLPELQMSPPKTIFVSGSLLLLDGFDFEQLEEVH